MQLDCWNIQGSSFHFGQRGLGQEETMVTMPSDSLFAALVARLARTEGKAAVEKFCADFVGENPKPPFVLSSTFPFAGKVKFFPVPMLARGGEAVGVDAKKLKRIQFVSEDVFRSLLKSASLAKIYNEKWTLQSGKLLFSERDYQNLPAELRSSGAWVWKLEQRPRVTLDRASSTPNLFHIGQVHFAKDCGLWFGVRWLEAGPDLKKQFSNMLHELAAAGFGAERSVGLGIAEVKQGDALDLPEASGAWVTLSRYLPRDDETGALSDKSSAYSIKSVGGWLDSPNNMGQRRIPVNLIEEGSVIGKMPPARRVPGQVVDVQPAYRVNKDVQKPVGHAVWRCGLALAVGMEGGVG